MPSLPTLIAVLLCSGLRFLATAEPSVEIVEFDTPWAPPGRPAGLPPFDPALHSTIPPPTPPTPLPPTPYIPTYPLLATSITGLFHRRGTPFNAHEWDDAALYDETCIPPPNPTGEESKNMQQSCFQRPHSNPETSAPPSRDQPRNNSLFDFVTARQHVSNQIKRLYSAAVQHQRQPPPPPPPPSTTTAHRTNEQSFFHVADPHGPNSMYVQSSETLLHGAEQLEYLVSQQILPEAFLAVARAYRQTRSAHHSPHSRQLPTFIPTLTHLRLQHYMFNTLIHVPILVPDAEGAARTALNPVINWNDVQKRYQKGEIVKIDNVLQPWALKAAHEYVLQGTVYFENSKTVGRDGKNRGRGGNYVKATSPEGLYVGVLRQITEELSAAMPVLIGDHEVLKEFSSYKYDNHKERGGSKNSEGREEEGGEEEATPQFIPFFVPESKRGKKPAYQQDGRKALADPAKINLNLWLTPDESVEAPELAGMTIYDFPVDTANNFQLNQRSRSSTGLNVSALMQHMIDTDVSIATIPYKQNCMIMFPAKLPYQIGTQEKNADLTFHQGYVHQRIDLNWLFGDLVDRETGEVLVDRE